MAAGPDDFLVLDARPITRRRLLSELWNTGPTLMQMARTDFRVRYKRAYLGLIWAVVIPLFQAAVLAAVFSQFVRIQTGGRGAYPSFVLSGVLAWAYFSSTLATGTGAIVDNKDLTEKVWFPRAMLPISPALANLVGLGVSLLAIVALTTAFRGTVGPEILLIVPGAALLVLFTTSLTLVLSAANAYFRDVRYIVAALLLAWFYATPIIYPAVLLKKYREFLDFNPLTGVMDLFRQAVGQPQEGAGRALVITLVVTAVLLVIAIEIYRRHDRLFVDRM